MKALFSSNIYRRANDFVVVPFSGGVGEIHFAVEPIERVAARLDELAQAIERSILASDLSLGAVDLRGYKSSIPKSVGWRSNKQFEATVLAVCGIYRKGGDIEIRSKRRADSGRGWVPTDRVVNVPPRSPTEVAQAAIALLGDPSA